MVQLDFDGWILSRLDFVHDLGMYVCQYAEVRVQWRVVVR